MRNVHPSVRIDDSARINCDDLTIGAGGVVGRDCVIEGRRVTIGRELWMDEGARIGGGSCRDPQAFLVAGDWLHLGAGSHINTARGVTIGDECGVGRGTQIFTHGAYLDELAGFPCDFAPIVIGSRVWLPSATVLPGVTIGSDVVVAAMSLVNRDIPSGCLAGGTPAKVLRDSFPRTPTEGERRAIIRRIAEECRALAIGSTFDTMTISTGATSFDLWARWISGPVTDASEVVRNQLRRHGIRFRFSPTPDGYAPWA